MCVRGGNDRLDNDGMNSSLSPLYSVCFSYHRSTLSRLLCGARGHRWCMYIYRCSGNMLELHLTVLPRLLPESCCVAVAMWDVTKATGGQRFIGSR